MKLYLEGSEGNSPVHVCVKHSGQMRPKQSHPVKGVSGRSAVRGIGMEIKITWHSDSISVCATVAEGPLTIQIHKVKLVRWREQERPAQTRVYAFSYWLEGKTPSSEMACLVCQWCMRNHANK